MSSCYVSYYGEPFCALPIPKEALEELRAAEKAFQSGYKAVQKKKVVSEADIWALRDLREKIRSAYREVRKQADSGEWGLRGAESISYGISKHEQEVLETAREDIDKCQQKRSKEDRIALVQKRNQALTVFCKHSEPQVQSGELLSFESRYDYQFEETYGRIRKQGKATEADICVLRDLREKIREAYNTGIEQCIQEDRWTKPLMDKKALILKSTLQQIEECQRLRSPKEQREMAKRRNDALRIFAEKTRADVLASPNFSSHNDLIQFGRTSKAIRTEISSLAQISEELVAPNFNPVLELLRSKEELTFTELCEFQQMLGLSYPIDVLSLCNPRKLDFRDAFYFHGARYYIRNYPHSVEDYARACPKLKKLKLEECHEYYKRRVLLVGSAESAALKQLKKNFPKVKISIPYSESE